MRGSSILAALTAVPPLTPHWHKDPLDGALGLSAGAFQTPTLSCNLYVILSFFFLQTYINIKNPVSLFDEAVIIDISSRSCRDYLATLYTVFSNPSCSCGGVKRQSITPE